MVMVSALPPPPPPLITRSFIDRLSDVKENIPAAAELHNNCFLNLILIFCYMSPNQTRLQSKLLTSRAVSILLLVVDLNATTRSSTEHMM